MLLVALGIAVLAVIVSAILGPKKRGSRTKLCLYTHLTLPTSELV